ncbi:MAG: Fe-S cluster assembly scaffold protein NifU [Oscillospiraceae bacterium]|nr:Fe-S cluster assembly scaffold protein NifU [Oscillospiraceae bacterium]
MLYTEKLMEHFTNPKNVGVIENPDGFGEVGNAKCGDIMQMYISVNDKEEITDIKFKTFGCGAAIATSSVATTMVKGKTIREALKITNKEVIEALEEIPAVKVHCSVLAEQALKSAVSDYYTKRGIDPTPIVGIIDESAAHH